MKKNFLKKLAFMMAAAVVVSSIAPAGAARAAAAPAISKKAKAVYVNGGNGVSEKTYTLKLKNKPAGSTNKWSTSNASVATVKGGKVTAVSAGKATITVKNTTKAGKAKSYTCTIEVKENANAIKISNVPTDNIVGIGTNVYDFNRSLTTVSGGKSTDKTQWTITDDTAGATIDSKGVVSTKQAGKFTLTATAYQSKALLAAGTTSGSDSITLTVAPSMQEVVQKATTKVDVTFDTDMSKTLTKDNITIINSGTKVKQVINGITFSADGKVATIKTYLELGDKTEYTITYGEQSKNFVASKGDAAGVTVGAKTVQYGKPTAFDVAIVDANGIEVTTDTTLANNVTFSYDTSKASVSWNSTDKKWEITMFNYNQSVEVKATYHTYKYENGKEVTFEGVSTFNSVKELKDNSSDLTYTIGKEKADWSNVNTVVPKGSTYKVFVKGTNQNGKTIAQGDCDFESADTSILTVYKNGSDVLVYGVKEGSGYIKCTYGDTTQLIPVTIGAEAKASLIKASKDSATLYRGGISDANIKFTIKDQFGTDLTSETPSVKVITSGADNVISYAATSDGNIKFSLKDGVTTTGTYTYQVTMKDKTTSVSITVENVDAAYKDISYIQVESSDTTMDPVVPTSDVKDKVATFTVYGYNSKGQKIAQQTAATFEVKLGDTTVKASDSTDKAYYTAVGGVVDFYGLKTAAGATSGAAIQAADGTYTVKATAKVNGSDKTASAVLTIKSTQAKPVVEVKSTQLDGARSVKTVISDALKFKVNGDEPSGLSITGVSCVVDSNSTNASGLDANVSKNVFVKTVTVQYPVNGVNLQQTVDVNVTITIK